MRWTRFLIPTAKETPAEAVAVSHQLALRAGLIRSAAPGAFTYLPLGWRVLRKIEAIAREGLTSAGAIELHPALLQASRPWEQSGRAAAFGEVLMRVRGSGWQDEVVLGAAYDEAVIEIAKTHLNSYKQLPCTLFRVGTRLRNESRTGGGLLHTREFHTLDAYSFDADPAGLEATHAAMLEHIGRILRRCDIRHVVADGEPGADGRPISHRFMVLAETGDDLIAVSEDGTYAADLACARRAFSPLPTETTEGASSPLTEVPTPGCSSIDDVAAFLEVPSSKLVKTLVYTLPDVQTGERKRYVVACIRGDHEASEAKLRSSLGVGDLTMADAEKARRDGFEIGFVGPHIANRVECILAIDPDARAVIGGVAGANRFDHHVTGFCWPRDVAPERLAEAIVADIRAIVPGDAAPNGSPLIIRRGIEVARAVKLGTRLSQPLDATFLDAAGKARPLVCGRYSLGLDRLLASTLESHYDQDGIRFPVGVAPFDVLIVALDVRDEHVLTTARRLHDALSGRGIDVLLDDRDARPGFKFKDADLVGIPVRLTVAAKALAEGKVELKMRGGQLEKLDLDAAVREVENRLGLSQGCGR
ncbi:MAG TPA: proline--tRNA ligase [Phycisphaerae bacterium]|nr:proline--tRNA ligase [Phycisphaerae bacterium]HRY69995.1 proline--tRNA ligase [Phycisphaerae bacterium]HSA27204.1 proline--tRNA ligase [Phycisphaerae bacterium]